MAYIVDILLFDGIEKSHMFPGFGNHVHIRMIVNEKPVQITKGIPGIDKGFAPRESDEFFMGIKIGNYLVAVVVALREGEDPVQFLGEGNQDPFTFQESPLYNPT